MTWISESIAGFPCAVFEPSRPNPHGFVILYLHGVHLNHLADQPPFCEQFERWGLPVVAPHGGRCWWANKVCADFDAVLTPQRHVLENVVPFIEGRWEKGRWEKGSGVFSAQLPEGRSRLRIGLLGTSMGGQGALRLAYRFPDKFPVVAAIAPALDYQLRYDEDEFIAAMYPDPEAVRQDTALLQIHALNWPRHQFFCCDPADELWWDGADRLRMKLDSLGIPHECDLETTGGGHGFSYYNRMAERAVRFLFERLEQERRRCASVP